MDIAFAAIAMPRRSARNWRAHKDVIATLYKSTEKFAHTTSNQKCDARLNQFRRDALPRGRNEGVAMRAFVRRFLMHYGIYRRYPLPRLSAFRNAWRNARA
jgi:hypothetical protein